MPSWGRREHFWGISCEKSRFYAQKILFFPILGRRAPVAPPPPPPLDPPLQTVIYKTLHKISNDRATRTREWTVLDPLVAPVVLLLLRCKTFSSYQKCSANENNARVNVTLILTFIMLCSFPITRIYHNVFFQKEYFN